jgi:membrane protein implicated in regulation of membrane protease activity
MGIGIGIFLLAVGAVLAFAVHVTVAGLSLVTIGWILMVVGVIGLVLDVALLAPRRRRVVTRSEPGYGGAAVTTRDEIV